MNNVSRLDFTDQQIYVGMDIHKKSWSISIFTDQFEHKTFSQPPEVGVLVNYLKRNFPVQPISRSMRPVTPVSGYTTGFRSGAYNVSWSIRRMCPQKTKSAQARPTGWTAVS